LRDQAALQRQLVAVDGNAWWQSLAIFVFSRIEHATNKSAKQVNRQLAPNTSIAIAIEKFLCDLFEQWVRRSEVNESVVLVVGYEFSATLDE
jgi:hypothetical protein